MTDEELRSYEYKVREAKRIKDTIQAIDEFIKKLGTTGKCEDIEFSYYGISTQSCFSLTEDDEYGKISFNLTPELLHLSTKEFQDLFTVPIVEYIKQIKVIKEKEFESLK